MPNAFEDRLVLLLPRLRAQAMLLCRNHTAADDLVQDAAMLALAGRASFTEGTNFAAWAHRILRNSFISGRRRHRKTIALDDAPPASLIQLPVAEDRLALRDLVQAMQGLSAGQQTCLVMVGVEGMSYAETAASAQIAVGTAKSYVSRARKSLRGMMRPDMALAMSAQHRAPVQPGAPH
jgi:RNA polymerase sigma-70 factor (ECF subfamily)